MNAGYVHLFCLERFMEFPDICSKLGVRAEDRVLSLESHGKNLSKIHSYSKFHRFLPQRWTTSRLFLLSGI